MTILTWNLDQYLNLTREIKPRQKILTITLCQEIATSLSFFGFLANLVQSGGRIPDTEYAKVMFSVIVTFCFIKTENRTKKSFTLLLWVKVLFGTKNAIFLLKNADISKINAAQALKGIFSETTYECVRTSQILSF